MTQQRIPGVFSVQQAPARPPIFYTIAGQFKPFPLDYRNRNYVYFWSAFHFFILTQEYAQFTQIDYPGLVWNIIPFPETTKLSFSTDSIIVQCTDVPLVGNTMLVPRLSSNLFQLNQETVSSFTTGNLSSDRWSELAIDFTVYQINGGTSPTVTFRVRRNGLDGQLYTLEQATPLSAPGVISYSVGAGLDGKSFAGGWGVDMVTTGSPTSVKISGSIWAKQ